MRIGHPHINIYFDIRLIKIVLRDPVASVRRQRHLHPASPEAFFDSP